MALTQTGQVKKGSLEQCPCLRLKPFASLKHICLVPYTKRKSLQIVMDWVRDYTVKKKSFEETHSEAKGFRPRS